MTDDNSNNDKEWILRPHTKGKAHLFVVGSNKSLCGTTKRYKEGELHVGPGYDPCELCMRIEEGWDRKTTLSCTD